MDPLVLIATAFIGSFIQYWIIRLAVRHALEDADERRNGTGPDDARRRSIGS
ncbi:hypothetical protein [Glycomyces albidus]|uniref:hypothetical protein n=1 Tax=Glycomyces albidus TaxID=2656774 RepID=UPI00188466EF|nr:hypothetical protein [Glycomyces albidus]